MTHFYIANNHIMSFVCVKQGKSVCGILSVIPKTLLEMTFAPTPVKSLMVHVHSNSTFYWTSEDGYIVLLSVPKLITIDLII